MLTEYILAVFCFFPLLTSQFNIDTFIPIVKSGVKNSAFGFSLLGHTFQNDDRGIIVGAPNSGMNGETYFCPPNGSGCQKLPVDVARLARTTDEFRGALFGYSMTTLNESSPHSITICAPRITRSSVSLVYITGGCFEVDASLKKADFILPSMSLCQEISAGERIIDLRHCTTGASVGRHPSAPNELYMGGPYFYYAKGIGAMVDMEKFTKAQTTTNGLLPNNLLGSSMDVSDRIYATDASNKSTIHVAFGGPGVPVVDAAQKAVGTGMVLIYAAFSTEYGSSIRPVLRLDGKQFGSRFGHSLIFVDINGDGWEDLIVGAPYQKLEATAGSLPEYGAVFVFLNQQNAFKNAVSDLEGLSPFAYHPETAYQVLTPPNTQNECGSSPLSGYGSSLAKIGDINHDGYQDFAVGAPYAEGGGVVFVYHGSKSGRILTPAQVICTANLPNNLQLDGLGFSLGFRGFDLDRNGYPDLAIGAPLSDSVVILRTRPVVWLEAHLTLPDGSTVIPENLNSLPECTKAESAISGYKGASIRCLDLKLFMTYSSIDGHPCKQDRTYRVSVLMKYDPVAEWFNDFWTESNVQSVSSQNGNCTHIPEARLRPGISEIYRKLLVAPISIIGERNVLDYAENVDIFFAVNKTVSNFGLKSPGGYKRVDLQATCRESNSVGPISPSSTELHSAVPLRMMFRDTNIIDQTLPLSFGLRWHADFPQPNQKSSDINDFPIADPWKNSQRVKLHFNTQCSHRMCCPSIRVEFDAEVQRDKMGPVVYVGDDKNQAIIIRARVSNLGTDPVYGLNLISTYPPNLLELNTSEHFGNSLSPIAAVCSLANPLQPGQTTQCAIKWQVIGHQLTVQAANFSVNSTVITGAGIPIKVDGSLRNELKVNIKMVAKVAVEGSVEPNTVYFSRNVSDGISSMTAENQIGDARLLIKFTVRNLLRHSLIPQSRLIIDWPYEIAGDLKEPHGKYMLYLLETPSVVRQQLNFPSDIINVSSVTCDSLALKKLVNPHGYRVFPFLKTTAGSAPVHLSPVELPSSHPNKYPPLTSHRTVEDVPRRFDDAKRKNGKRTMTTISCYNGQLRCVPIVCDLGKLSYKAGPITLEFSARLWDNTMREDFKELFLTRLQMTATWRADVKYAIDLGDSDHAQEIIELLIFNNLEPKPIVPKYMPLYIGLAVFGGVLLLAILIIILQKAGFFKRKRFVRRPRKDVTDERKQPTSLPPHRSAKPSGGNNAQGTRSRTKGFEPLQADSSDRGTYRSMR